MRKHALQPRGARGAAYTGGEHMKRKVIALLLVAAPPFVALPAHAVPNIEHLTVKPSGSTPQRLEYGVVDRRTKLIKYTYKTAGTYRVKVSGTGKHACAGTREARISVATAAQSAKASEKTAARPKCPRGWTLVADSFKGERYTCRADPPAQALKCGGGTAGVEIGRAHV